MGTRLHPEDMPWFQEGAERARRGGHDLEFEHRLLMPDGAVKYLHVVGRGSRDQAGQLEYIGAVRDVTERRLSQDALATLGERYSSLTRREREIMALVVAGLFLLCQSTPFLRHHPEGRSVASRKN